MNESVAQGGMQGLFKPNFGKILEEIKLVCTDPVGCWGKVRGTYGSLKDFYLSFFGVLAIIPAVSAFLISIISGLGIGFGIAQLVLGYVVSLLGLFVCSLILGTLSKALGNGSDDQLSAAKLIGYSQSPYLLVAILGVIPVLGSLATLLVGLYGIYIFYQGLSPMLAVAPEKRLLTAIVSAVACMVVMFVLMMMIGLILLGGGLAGGLG